MRRNPFGDGFSSEWRNRLQSKSLIGIFLLLFMVASSPRAGAECWTWKKMATQTNSYADVLVYDKSANKLAALWGLGTQSAMLSYFDGTDWELIWAGIPNTGNPNYNYWFTYGFYFDDTLNALVLFGDINISGTFSGGTAAFKYIPGQGFVICSELAPIGTASSYFESVTYDSIRKRAVIIGVNDRSGRLFFAEFDGTQFYIIVTPNNLSGILTFDENIGKVVLYGCCEPSCPHGYNSTCEYDGNSWSIIYDQGIPCSADAFCIPVAMTYSPDLLGVVAIGQSNHESRTWLLRQSKWSRINVAQEISILLSPVLGHDASTNTTICVGDFYQNGEDVSQTFKLYQGGHCRPLSKP
jgi:hypothetical protein